MKNQGRYNTKGSDEGEFEPGSNGLVLKNLLGISKLQELEEYETSMLSAIVKKLAIEQQKVHSFCKKDICDIHKLWLGKLYSWAGEYRSVNMSKGGFTFAAAHLLPKLMQEFEKTILVKYTPCSFSKKSEIIEALAVVHTELVLIHPFREGNGRLARVLSVLMGLQAGLRVLDFSDIKGNLQESYFAAVRAGLDLNYKPMKAIFEKVVERSL